MDQTNIHTKFLILIFASIYLLYILRETAKWKIDIYDLCLLSTVAIIPCGLVVFPIWAFEISNFFGVRFPFVLMFGFLFVFVFIFIYRLTKKVHALEADNRMLIQEISILNQSLITSLSENK